MSFDVGLRIGLTVYARKGEKEWDDLNKSLAEADDCHAAMCKHITDLQNENLKLCREAADTPVETDTTK